MMESEIRARESSGPVDGGDSVMEEKAGTENPGRLDR